MLVELEDSEENEKIKVYNVYGPVIHHKKLEFWRYLEGFNERDMDRKKALFLAILMLHYPILRGGEAIRFMILLVSNLRNCKILGTSQMSCEEEKFTPRIIEGSNQGTLHLGLTHL